MLRLFRREPPPAREADFIDVSHGGETYRVRVRRSASAKRFTLRIRTAARDIVLTMPARASFKQGKSFAERHGAWIGAKLRRVPEKIGFELGDSVPLRGVPHSIALAARLREPGRRHRRGAGRRRRHAVGSRRRRLYAAARAGFSDSRGAARPRPGRSLVTPAALASRSAGSLCATRRAGGDPVQPRAALNFSWRLILAPPFVLDYLAAHEVAHLVHMNHSDAFWTSRRALVARRRRRRSLA